MGIKIIQDDTTAEKFIHFYNTRGIFMARIPMPDDFESYTDQERYNYLRTHHLDLIRRIR